MRTMVVPCRRDLACFRTDGHDGDHAYATPETRPMPAEALHPVIHGPVLDKAERLAHDFALDYGTAYPKTYPDVLALEADLARFLGDALAATSLDCEDCAHPMTEHATPGGECIHAFCDHDFSLEAVRRYISTAESVG